MFGGITDVFKNIPGLNTLSTAMDLIEGIKSGDLSKILSSVSQLALTYATGGAGALFSQLGPMVSNLGSGMVANALTGAAGVEAGLGAIAMLGKEMGLPQGAIDAAQALFAEQQGDWRAERTNARQAGMGNSLNNVERQQAGVFLDMIKDAGSQRQSPFEGMLSTILAGPNAGPSQLGGAQGLLGSLMQNIVQSMIQEVLGGMASEAGINGQTDAADNSGNRLNDQRTGDNLREEGEKRKREAKAPGQLGGEIMNELGIDGGGFLLRFAMLLGEALDKKTDEMMKVAEAMNQETETIGSFDTSVNEKKGGFLGFGKKDQVNQDKQNEFNQDMAASNSRMQTLGAILNGTGKELDALQTALKTALDSIGGSQKNLATGR